MPTLDLSKYTEELGAPKGNKAQEPSAWRSAISTLNTNLEHQRLRSMNLELLIQYGADSWKCYNSKYLEAGPLPAFQKHLLRTYREEIASTNRKRKTAQTDVASTLVALDSEWFQIAQNTIALESECFLLEKKLRMWVTEASNRGLEINEEEQQQQQQDQKRD